VTPLVQELVHLLNDDKPDQTKLVDTFYRMNPSFLRGRQVRQRILIASTFASPLPVTFSCIGSSFLGRCAPGYALSSQRGFKFTARRDSWDVEISADYMFKAGMWGYIDQRRK